MLTPEKQTELGELTADSAPSGALCCGFWEPELVSHRQSEQGFERLSTCNREYMATKEKHLLIFGTQSI